MEEEELEDEELQEQLPSKKKNDGSHLAPWQFKPGQSGNPKGRKPGPSLKEWARHYLASLTPKEKLEFLKGMNKTDIWKMGEGNPDNKTDVTTKGETINTSDPALLALAKEYEAKLKQNVTGTNKRSRLDRKQSNQE